MEYPRVEIDLNKLIHNTKQLVDLCNSHNITVAGVTKVFCAEPNIVESYIKGGVNYLADSRVENLKKMKDYKIPKILLRIPMLTEVEDVVEYSDISLNSEIKVIEALSNISIKKGKVHNIILMVDLGDLREGYFQEDSLYQVIESILKLPGVDLIGLGTNLSCYGGVIPEKENLSKLTYMAENIENKFKIKLDIISGGNSSSLHLLYNNSMPDGINNLRLGESLVLGRETAFGEKINGTYEDVFKLVVEAIEIKEKPSVPIGKIGMDAFGKTPTFNDRGIRKRMICAIGKQDVELSDIKPVDEDIIILGGSSDHLLLDIRDSKIEYTIGDKISFNMSYGAILSTMTSPYVKKVYV